VVDYFPIVERLVRNSDAISLAAVQYTQTRIFQSRFACVPYDGLLRPAALCAATRQRWSPRPAVRAFIQSCRERFPT
jgi:hypothetical protein